MLDISRSKAIELKLQYLPSLSLTRTHFTVQSVSQKNTFQTGDNFISFYLFLLKYAASQLSTILQYIF